MNAMELRKHRARIAQRKYRYGITEEHYDRLMAEQNNACAVCKTKFDESVRANVDHDHNCCPQAKSCGKCLRGILCTRCITLASIMETGFQHMDDMFRYLTKYLNEGRNN